MRARELIPSRAVVAATLIFIAVYVALDFNKLYALRYGADTGTFLQWFAGALHGWGSWNGAEYRPHLQVHDSWILLALVPLMAAFPYAQTLLVVQVVAIAGAAAATATTCTTSSVCAYGNAATSGSSASSAHESWT